MLLLFLVGALLINTFSKATDPDDEAEDSISEEPVIGERSDGEESSVSSGDSGRSKGTGTPGPD